ncbi:unnamed protein product, partial [Polarella glacialis]
MQWNRGSPDAQEDAGDAAMEYLQRKGAKANLFEASQLTGAAMNYLQRIRGEFSAKAQPSDGAMEYLTRIREGSKPFAASSARPTRKTP